MHNAKEREPAPIASTLWESKEKKPQKSRGLWGLGQRRNPTALPKEEALREFSFVWPSGRGTEIGTIVADLTKVWSLIQRNSEKASTSFKMYNSTENGVEAIVVLGLANTPLSIVFEPNLSKTRLSIVADINANLDKVKREIDNLLKGLVVTFEM